MSSRFVKAMTRNDKNHILTVRVPYAKVKIATLFPPLGRLKTVSGGKIGMAEENKKERKVFSRNLK